MTRRVEVDRVQFGFLATTTTTTTTTTTLSQTVKSTQVTHSLLSIAQSYSETTNALVSA